MAALVALCSGLGRRTLTHFVTAAVCLTDSGTHAVLWRRSCSQYKQVTSNEHLPVPMENPYKEPLKKCILCGKRVDYKNVQLLSQFISPFTGCIYGRHITGILFSIYYSNLNVGKTYIKLLLLFKETGRFSNLQITMLQITMTPDTMGSLRKPLLRPKTCNYFACLLILS
ncbi:28S ribosomal protein S18c, mitochondrial isoform X1 [Balaenoptera musculus]|uniref:28S ribosomal protein S18c, mitochondrial isoform X1 n=1 Tax=Balaenoptera musculus TaxID=9771 RepID=A0A8B8XL41_BALMU|nr:28S ribosomal protein S18c, mitochondrial isoform X1 [Balaenoptera musculus]XP_036708466.1 28S ribosomal protein S18c, mitochondrial isoform X1 [Balaenoptera musculus]